MLPYFQINSFLIGPLTIQVWGLFVSLGILTGIYLSYRLAKKYFISAQVLLDMAVWALVGGLLGGRIFYWLFYSLDYYLLNPLDAFKFWRGGASSLGGFFGAAVAAWVFVKIRHFTWKESLPYLDIGIVGLWLGWGIGRIGCFLIHDHVGRLSNFFLAVNFPFIGIRHDLGLYDSLLGFVLFGVFLLFFKPLVRRGWGLVTGYSILTYAIVRFFLDFLRETDLEEFDIRYFYLTPAQWGMIVIILTLTFLLVLGRIRQQKNISK